MSEVLELEFNYPTEKIYCGRCGKECVPLGHLMSEFLMCPTHGEFTIAPVVTRKYDQVTYKHDGKWYIHFNDATEQGMWETCRSVDEQGLSGRATRTV